MVAELLLALGLLSPMHRTRPTPNVINYDAAISAYSGKIVICSELPQLDAENEVDINVISCNATISASKRGVKLQVALDLLNSMCRIGRTLNIIMENCGRR